MKRSLTLTVESLETISELPGYWTPENLAKLLDRLEFEDRENVSEDQLRDYAIMALQDLDCADAARALIDITLGSSLSEGKKQNISEEMEAERLWEEYPDLSCHEPIFNAQTLLATAFPSAQTPETYRIVASLTGKDAATQAYLKSLPNHAPPEALIVRCFAAASPDSAILNRLFEDQITGGNFPEAEHLVWQILASPAASGTGLSLTLYSPIRWSKPLEEGLSVDCLIEG